MARGGQIFVRNRVPLPTPEREKGETGEARCLDARIAHMWCSLPLLFDRGAQVAWDGSGPTESSAHVCVCNQNQPRHHCLRSKKGNRARRRPVAPARSLPRAAALPPPTCTCPPPPPALLVALQGRIYVGVKPLLWKKISVLVVVLGQVADRTKLTSPFCDSHTFAGGVMRSCWVAAVLAVLGLAR